MNEIDKLTAIEWLNRMVAMAKIINQPVKLSNGLKLDTYTRFLSTCGETTLGIQIGSDIVDFVAEAVGQTVKERDFDDGYIARYFIYDGVDVFALVDEEEVG